MAVAPITGILKKKVAVDVSIGFTIGLVAASYWWWGFHKPLVQKREDYYTKLATQSAAEDEE
jgi:cytochrome c oxidase subunit 7